MLELLRRGFPAAVVAPLCGRRIVDLVELEVGLETEGTRSFAARPP
jgi:hypothetical protein